jgi:hypothetical protein
MLVKPPYVREREREMENTLIENFEYVQGLIDDIKRQPKIDIKQISDLQRYVEMQKHIVYSLCLLAEGARR